MSDRRIAFITGASRGIGRGIALELAGGGFDIAGGGVTWDPDNQQKGLAEVAARCAELGADFLPVAGDIGDLDTHQPMLAQIADHYGRIDLFVSNAGAAPPERLDILETTPDNFDHTWQINGRGSFFLAQAVAQQMVAQVQAASDPAASDPGAQPAMVFITSISADTSSPTRTEYCMVKAAISQAARTFADRLLEFGINVYEVRPGLIATDMTAPVKQAYDTRIAAGLIPQGRWGQPEDIARVIGSLARGDFSYATGLVVEISGGMNLRRL